MSFISVGCEKAERGPAPLPSPEQVPPAEVDAAVAPKVAQDAEVYRDPLHWGHKGKVPKGCHAAESMGQSAAPPVGFVVEFRSWAGPRGESGMRIFADGRTQRLIRGAGDDLWGAATPLSPAQLRRVKDRISSARIADLHPLYERDEIGSDGGASEVLIPDGDLVRSIGIVGGCEPPELRGLMALLRELRQGITPPRRR